MKNVTFSMLGGFLSGEYGVIFAVSLSLKVNVPCYFDELPLFKLHHVITEMAQQTVRKFDVALLPFLNINQRKKN